MVILFHARSACYDPDETSLFGSCLSGLWRILRIPIVKKALTPLVFLFLTSTAFGQIRWINRLEDGLSEARDRNAPVFAFFWDYN